MDFNVAERGLIEAINGLFAYNCIKPKNELDKTGESKNAAPLDVESIFNKFYHQLADYVLPPENSMVIDIRVKTPVKTITISIGQDDKIAHLKAKIHAQDGISPDRQKLIFASTQLQDGRTLRDYGISKDSTIILLERLCGGGSPIYYIAQNYLDRQWDYDYKQITFDLCVYRRNDFVYQRPLGSYRFAIKVLDKYANNDWLGKSGEKRYKSDDKEWPVAYHGTLNMNAKGIVENGFCLDKGVRFLYGKGIYCSPNPFCALSYASSYTYEGKVYRLIMQTRVDPAKLKIVKTGSHMVNHDEYWILPDANSIRPYGICVYEKPGDGWAALTDKKMPAC